jgi:small subunit ribosomal protein S18
MARSGLRPTVKKKRKKTRRMEPGRVRGTPMNADQIDYKDIPLLQRMTTAQGKLFSRKRSGLDAKAQRALSLAVKRARFMALMPFVS